MADDWIKVTHALPDKPEVWGISAATGLDVDAVVGKLIRVWIWFDTNTIDGNAFCNAASVTKNAIDRFAGFAGFFEAMVSVGWLRCSEEHVSVVNFDYHHGQSAKKRALTAKRVRRHRNAECNAASVTQALPEKRREESKKTKKKSAVPDDFALTPEMRQAAVDAWTELGRLDLDPDREFAGFLSHHRAHASKMASWEQAWETWYRNAPKFNRHQPTRVPGRVAV
jgi:hypothetical protein